MNIIVISLEKAKERRKRIKEQLDSLNIDAIIMDAVDGEKLSKEEKDKKLSLIDGYRYGENFTVGEIGCLMSHTNAIKLAKEKGWEHVIIVEDDVIFAEDFEKRVELLFKMLPKDWEHVYLSGFPRTPRDHDPLVQMLHVEPSGIIDCIPITMIRNTAYDKIISYLEKFETTADDSIIAMIFKFKNLKSYTYFPFAGYVDDEYTYIWNHELKREHKSKKYFKNKIN